MNWVPDMATELMVGTFLRRVDCTFSELSYCRPSCGSLWVGVFRKSHGVGLVGAERSRSWAGNWACFVTDKPSFRSWGTTHEDEGSVQVVAVYSRSNSSDPLRYTVKKSAHELFVPNGSNPFKAGWGGTRSQSIYPPHGLGEAPGTNTVLPICHFLPLPITLIGGIPHVFTQSVGLARTPSPRQVFTRLPRSTLQCTLRAGVCAMCAESSGR